MHDLHQEVWAKYSYIQQARKVQALEDMSRRAHKGGRLGHWRPWKQANTLLNDLKYEIVNYFDELGKRHHPWRKHAPGRLPHPDLHPQARRGPDGLRPRGAQAIRALVAHLDEFKAIRKPGGIR
jgi:hypothetical protein